MRHLQKQYAVMAVVLALVIVSQGGLMAESFKVQEEKLLLESIEIDPQSEENYYNYAFFLFGEDRYQDAKLQINKVLKLNPNHINAKKLLAGLNEIKSIQDPKKRKVKKADIAMGFLNDINLKLSDSINNLKNFDSPENIKKKNQRLQDLNEKYEISSYREVDFFSKEKFEKEMMVNKLIMSKKYARAEKLYKELLEEYPKSFTVYENYVGFLVRQERFAEASRQTVEGLKKFPENPKLRIYRDGLDRLASAPSTEQQNLIKMQIHMDIVDTGTILMNMALGKIK